VEVRLHALLTTKHKKLLFSFSINRFTTCATAEAAHCVVRTADVTWRRGEKPLHVLGIEQEPDMQATAQIA
jgi:hypothetical protein